MGETSYVRLIHPDVILVATDLSDLHRVMPFAIQMAEKTGARLELLHILQGVEFTTEAVGVPYFNREYALSIATNMLKPWCERARKLGLRCEAVIRDGNSAEEIISQATLLHADRLVLGTRSRSKLGKLLLGSIAEQVLRSASLPVFTIGPEAHLPSENKDHLPTVLFATSLGEGHHAGAALASQIAASQHGKLIILHVLPPLVEKEGRGETNVLYSTILHDLLQLAHRVGAESCQDVEVRVLYGNPADQILDKAAANQVDLIIMQTNNHPKFYSMIHDHTIYRVLAHAQCPVLTLRTPEAKGVESETGKLAVRDE